MIKRGTSKKGTRACTRDKTKQLVSCKHSVSPIIATVLLIILVIIIAFLIFWWAKKFVGEACQKNEKAAELKCQEISLDATKSGSSLYLDNKGNVPIYKVEVKIKADGSKSSEILPDVNLAPGQVNTWEVPGIDTIGAEVKIVPILKGSKKVSLCEHTCDNIEIEVLEAE